jgi:hypothetical protein
MTANLKNPSKSWSAPLVSAWRAAWGAVSKSGGAHPFLTGDDGDAKSPKTRISDPYKQSSWVYAALGLIADPITSARLRFLDGPGGDLIDSPTLDAFFAEPARTAHAAMPLDEFVNLSIAVRGVYGRVFWVLDDSWLARTSALYNRVILASDAQMTPILDGRRLGGWAYRGGAGEWLTFQPEQVIMLRMPNPHDPDSLEGIPPWRPARDSAEAAAAASRFAKRVMDQNGDRGMIIRAEHALNAEQREMLRAELREKRRAAERGEYRDSVMGFQGEILTPSLSAISGEFAGQVALSRDEIFVAYGVPASMATVAASYSVGSASDWYRLITSTCSREARALAAGLSRIADYLEGRRSLASEIAGGSRRETGIVADFDFSSHPVMEQIRAERTEQVERLFKMGVPVSTANEYLNLGMPEYSGWDERWLPVSLAPVSMRTDSPPSKSVSGSGSVSKSAGAGEALDSVARLWSERERSRKAEIATRQSAEREARWARVDGARSADRARMQKLISRHLMTARSETLANLRKAYGEGGDAKGWSSDYQIRAGVLDIVFNFDRWFGGFWGDLGRMLGGIFRAASEAAAEEVDVPGDFDPLTEADPRVVEHLERRENLIQGSTEETHRELTVSLEEGIQAGETLDELTERVRSIFRGADKAKGLTIARTETGAAYETARYYTFKAAGITQKGWLSGGEDGVTRATHQAADGQVRGIDETFDVGAAKLLHPHDQVNGAQYPEELINCRCVLTAEG